MTTGIVLDILRCSLHDGPGIRTTVFLKGCPLSCLWCHNPESQSLDPVLAFNAERCTRCGLCVPACPRQCHTVDSGTHSIDRGKCTACGERVLACPARALEVFGRAMTVPQVIAEVAKDAAYYRHSGGGLTISGGEPMLQSEFTSAIAQAAREAHFHTVLETSGVAPPERFRHIMPKIDLFLFDYKGTDPRLHQKHTGASNQLLLRNLDLLYHAGCRIRLRCPLVPGVNDGEDRLRGIADLSHRYPKIEGIELMPYHRMGNEKARRAGLKVKLDQPNADATSQQAWLARLTALGCRGVSVH